MVLFYPITMDLGEIHDVGDSTHGKESDEKARSFAG